MSDIDRLFSDSGKDVTLRQLLELEETLDQLRRWQLLDFPTLQQLLDFLTRGDVVAEIFETMLTPPVVRVSEHPALAAALPARADHTEIAIRRGSTTAAPGDDGASGDGGGKEGGEDGKDGGGGAGAPSDGKDGDDGDGDSKAGDSRRGLQISVPPIPSTGAMPPGTPRLHVTPRPGETCKVGGGVWNPEYEFYRHQYVCCRLLCMDPFGGNVVTFMCASTAAYARAWAAFMGALSREEELDPIIAQYICQVLRQFSQRDFEKLCAKFIEPAVVAGLVFHLGQPPFVDFLLDFLQPSLGAAATTFAGSFLNRLVAVVARTPRGEYEDNLFANICLLLCNIGDSPDARNDTTIRGYLVGRIIKVKDISFALIDATFAELQRMPSLPANQSWMLPVITTFVGLLECGCCHGFSASDTMKHNRSTSLCPLLVGLLDKSGRLGTMLRDAFNKKKKFALHISQILDLWHSLLRVECGALDQSFCDSGAIEASVDIFFSMRANSTLLARLMDLYESVLARDARDDTGLTRTGYGAGQANLAMSNLGYDALQVRLLRDCRLADRIVAFFSPRGRLDDSMYDSSVASGSESEAGSPRMFSWKPLGSTGRRPRSKLHKRPASGAPRPRRVSSPAKDAAKQAAGAGAGAGAGAQVVAGSPLATGAATGVGGGADSGSEAGTGGGAGAGGGEGDVLPGSPRPGAGGKAAAAKLTINLPNGSLVQTDEDGALVPPASVRRRLSGSGGINFTRVGSPARSLQGDLEGAMLPRVDRGRASPPRSPAHGTRPKRSGSPALRRSVDSPMTVMAATARTATPRLFNQVHDKCLMGYVVCLANAIMQSRCSELLESDDSWRAFVEGPLRTINAVWGESVLHDEGEDDDDMYEESRGSDGFNLWDIDDDEVTGGGGGGGGPAQDANSGGRGGGGDSDRAGSGGTSSGSGEAKADGGDRASTGGGGPGANSPPGQVSQGGSPSMRRREGSHTPLGALYDEEDNELMRSLVMMNGGGDARPSSAGKGGATSGASPRGANGSALDKSASPRARVGSAGRERQPGPRRNSAGDMPPVRPVPRASEGAESWLPPTVAEGDGAEPVDDDDTGDRRGNGGDRRSPVLRGHGEGQHRRRNSSDGAPVVEDEAEARFGHSGGISGGQEDLPFSRSLERKLDGEDNDGASGGGDRRRGVHEGKLPERPNGRRGSAGMGRLMDDDSKAEVVEDDDLLNAPSGLDDGAELDVVEDDEIPRRGSRGSSGDGKAMEYAGRRNSDDPRDLLRRLGGSGGIEVVDDDDSRDEQRRRRRRSSDGDALSKLADDDDGRHRSSVPRSGAGAESRGHISGEGKSAFRPPPEGDTPGRGPRVNKLRLLSTPASGDEDEVEEDLIASPVTLGPRFEGVGGFASPSGVGDNAALPVDEVDVTTVVG